MALGDKFQIGHYTLVGQESTQDDNANDTREAALVDVYKDGRYVTRLNPELRFYKASGGQPDHKVAIRHGLFDHLNVIYAGRNPDTLPPIIKACMKPLVSLASIGVLVLVFST